MLSLEAMLMSGASSSEHPLPPLSTLSRLSQPISPTLVLALFSNIQPGDIGKLAELLWRNNLAFYCCSAFICR